MLKIQNRLGLSDSEAQSNGSISIAKNQFDDKCAPVSAIIDRADPVKYLWIRAPKAMVYSQYFTDGAKLLYLILLDYQGRNPYAFPSLDTLARDTGKSTRRVQQILKELEEGGAVEIISQPGWVNLYRVGLPPVSDTTPTAAAADDATNTIMPETELADNANTGDRTEPSPQHDTPQKYIAPLPMKPVSTELDAFKLENTVCKKSRVANTRKDNLLSLNTSNHQSPTINHQVQLTQTNTTINQSDSYVKLELKHSTLSNEQTEIAKMLHIAGVASVDAERIALTNPARADVQQWIEFARSKTNPGGYLAVVLGKVDAAPPPSPSKSVNLPVLENTPATSRGQYQVKKNWHGNKRNRLNNQEAGALAYIRRHQNELEKWQSDQYQDSANACEQTVNQSDSYVKLSNDASCEQPAPIGIIEQTVKINQLPVLPSMASSEPGGPSGVDSQLRGIIRQLDKGASQYLKQARIEGNKLIISFVGNYQPNANIKTWLPMLQLSYEAVSEILLL